MAYCRKCGITISENYKTCPLCGSPLDPNVPASLSQPGGLENSDSSKETLTEITIESYVPDHKKKNQFAGPDFLTIPEILELSKDPNLPRILKMLKIITTLITINIFCFVFFIPVFLIINIPVAVAGFFTTYSIFKLVRKYRISNYKFAQHIRETLIEYAAQLIIMILTACLLYFFIEIHRRGDNHIFAALLLPVMLNMFFMPALAPFSWINTFKLKEILNTVYLKVRYTDTRVPGESVIFIVLTCTASCLINMFLLMLFT